MKLLTFWKPLIWLALICVGLFLPASDLPTKPFLNIPHFDKIVHFGLFFMFCLLLFNPFKKIETNYYFFAPFTAIIFGASLEALQKVFTPSRSSDIYDFIANSSGIVIAIFFYLLFVSGKKWEKFF